MKFKFTSEHFKEIEKVLGVKFTKRGDLHRAVLKNPQEGRRLTLEIYTGIPIGKEKGNLISIFTPYSHSQLHFCTGFVASAFLGEVTFFAEFSGRLSGIIVEKQVGCSVFTNVDANLLSGDFTQLAPEVMLSGIALSLTEPLLESRQNK